MWILKNMHERVSFNLYRHLENILETLSDYGVPATFFIIGEMAERHPRIPEKICKYGHEIASHGYLHKNLSEVSYAEAENEMSKSIKILRKFQDIKGFRAPYLLNNKGTYTACEKLGLTYDSSEYGLVKYCPKGFSVTVLPVISPIDIHGLDFLHLPSKDLVAKWLLLCGKSNGATVCMHVWRIGRKKHIETILVPMLESGLTFVRAFDLLDNNGVALTFEVEYTSLGDFLPSTLRLGVETLKTAQKGHKK